MGKGGRGPLRSWTLWLGVAGKSPFYFVRGWIANVVLVCYVVNLPSNLSMNLLSARQMTRMNGHFKSIIVSMALQSGESKSSREFLKEALLYIYLICSSTPPYVWYTNFGGAIE